MLFTNIFCQYTIEKKPRTRISCIIETVFKSLKKQVKAGSLIQVESKEGDRVFCGFYLQLCGFMVSTITCCVTYLSAIPELCCTSVCKKLLLPAQPSWVYSVAWPYMLLELESINSLITGLLKDHLPLPALCFNLDAMLKVRSYSTNSCVSTHTVWFALMDTEAGQLKCSCPGTSLHLIGCGTFWRDAVSLKAECRKRNACLRSRTSRCAPWPPPPPRNSPIIATSLRAAAPAPAAGGHHARSSPLFS